MTTAQEIARHQDIAWEREARRAEQGLLPAYAYTIHHAWHDHVYLPTMAKLIADMRAKGLLPKETL
jgi:hypothetical protein